MKYPVIIEHGERNFSVYVPDLPGCVSTGSTSEEAQDNIREAIELHLAGMREDGLTGCGKTAVFPQAPPPPYFFSDFL